MRRLLLRASWAGRSAARRGAAADGARHRAASSSAAAAAAALDSPATTFVSAYFRLEAGAAAAYLDRHGLAFRDTPTHHVVRACPLCAKPHADKPDNLWKLYVRRADGAFFCHRCGVSGSWYDLKSKLGDLAVPTPAAGGGAAGGGGALGSLGFLGGSSNGGGGGGGAMPSRAAVAPQFSGGSKLGGATAAAAVTAAGLSMPLTPAGVLATCAALLDTPSAFPDVYAYLTRTRGLEPDVLREYAVGAVAKAWPSSAPQPPPAPGSSSSAYESHDCIVFPWLSALDGAAGGAPAAPSASSSSALIAAAFGALDGPARHFSTPLSGGGGGGGGQGGAGAPPPRLLLEPAQLALARVKLRSVRDKAKQVLLPRGGGWGLFGLHTVPATASSLVLTEGEFDALSVRQGTGAHAASLPNGCRSLPVEVLPALERFSRLYLWLDDDGPGREGADRIASKLGLGRCYIVRPTAELILPRVPPAAVVGGAGGSEGGGGGEPPPPLPPPPVAGAAGPGLLLLPKDANEALTRGLDLAPLLEGAAPKPHDAIVSVAELRPALLREVAAALGIAAAGDDARSGGGGSARGWTAAGVPIRCLPGLQRLLKGHRPGEITIVTGPTGCGKTTLLAQLSLDLAAQGVPTLWGSFEIKAPRLLATMAAQLRSGRVAVDPRVAAEAGLLLPPPPPPQPPRASSGAAGGADVDILLDPETGAWSESSSHAAAAATATTTTTLAPREEDAAAAVMRQFELAADSLAALPLHVLRFFGSTDVDKVVDALEYAAYAHDVRHVILDNLQFMMSGATGAARGFDKFEVQERALDRFRAFATKHDVHVTLVVHPRKESEDEPLTLSSVFGSAKATQEADTVVILQRESARQVAQAQAQAQQQAHGGGGGGGYGSGRAGYQQQQQQQQRLSYVPEPGELDVAPEPRKYLDVRKNRYDGTLGRVLLAFDPESKCFFEPGSPPLSPAASSLHSRGGGGGGGGAPGGGAAMPPGSGPFRRHGVQQQQQQPPQQLRQFNQFGSSAAAMARATEPPQVTVTRRYGPMPPPAVGSALAAAAAAQPASSHPASPAVDMGLLGAMTSASFAGGSGSSCSSSSHGAVPRRGYSTSARAAAVTPSGAWVSAPRAPGEKESATEAAARRKYWAAKKRAAAAAAAAAAGAPGHEQQPASPAAAAAAAAVGTSAAAAAAGSLGSRRAPYAPTAAAHGSAGSPRRPWSQRGGAGLYAPCPPCLATEVDEAVRALASRAAADPAWAPSPPLLEEVLDGCEVEAGPHATRATTSGHGLLCAAAPAEGAQLAGALHGGAPTGDRVCASGAGARDQDDRPVPEVGMEGAVAAVLAQVAADEEAARWAHNGCRG